MNTNNYSVNISNFFEELDKFKQLKYDTANTKNN
jgi:hypothetical protein